MFVIFAVFVNIFGLVQLGPVNPLEQNLSFDSLSSWSPDCKAGAGKVPRLVPNPGNCRSFFICSNGAPREYFCSEGKVFNPERQRCVRSYCTKSEKKWPAFQACPDDWSIEMYFRNEEDCSMFYQCDNGDAVPHRCPPNTEWNDDKWTCDHPWNVKCESRSFIPGAKKIANYEDKERITLTTALL